MSAIHPARTWLLAITLVSGALVTPLASGAIAADCSTDDAQSDLAGVPCVVVIPADLDNQVVPDAPISPVVSDGIALTTGWTVLANRAGLMIPQWRACASDGHPYRAD